MYVSINIEYCSKVSYMYHCLARRVSFHSRLLSRQTRWVSTEMRRVLFLASALKVPIPRIWRLVKIQHLYRIISIRVVDMIFILISDACLPSVYVWIEQWSMHTCIILQCTCMLDGRTNLLINCRATIITHVWLLTTVRVIYARETRPVLRETRREVVTYFWAVLYMCKCHITYSWHVLPLSF